MYDYSYQESNSLIYRNAYMKIKRPGSFGISFGVDDGVG